MPPDWGSPLASVEGGREIARAAFDASLADAREAFAALWISRLSEAMAAAGIALPADGHDAIAATARRAFNVMVQDTDIMRSNMGDLFGAVFELAEACR